LGMAARARADGAPHPYPQTSEDAQDSEANAPDASTAPTSAPTPDSGGTPLPSNIVPIPPYPFPTLPEASPLPKFPTLNLPQV